MRHFLFNFQLHLLFFMWLLILCKLFVMFFSFSSKIFHFKFHMFWWLMWIAHSWSYNNVIFVVVFGFVDRFLRWRFCLQHPDQHAYTSLSLGKCFIIFYHFFFYRFLGWKRSILNINLSTQNDLSNWNLVVVFH